MCRNRRLSFGGGGGLQCRAAAGEQAGSGRPSPSFVRVGKEEEGDLDHTYIGGQAGVQDPRVIQCRWDINVRLISSA